MLLVHTAMHATSADHCPCTDAFAANALIAVAHNAACDTEAAADTAAIVAAQKFIMILLAMLLLMSILWLH